jgi:ubiquinone/menaquinone biosynthesis C-methylase UbiE
MKLSWQTLENSWRRQLLSHATGSILEVEVGTGNNFKYYPDGVNITATDLSSRMLVKAKVEAEKRNVTARFINAPIEDLKFGKQRFDTIVSTFSLSAYQDPVFVLKLFNTWCKPDGSILLLEYGLSRYDIVSWMQRKWGSHYYKRTGNHVDRDMLTMITGSKLRIKRVEVKYAGIVYLVWAALKPGAINDGEI